MIGNFNMGTIQALQFFFQSAILLSLAHLVMCSCVGRFGRFLYKHWKLFQNCSKVAACTTKQFVICPFKPLDSWGCTGKSGENKKSISENLKNWNRKKVFEDLSGKRMLKNDIFMEQGMCAQVQVEKPMKVSWSNGNQKRRSGWMYGFSRHCGVDLESLRFDNKAAPRSFFLKNNYFFSSLHTQLNAILCKKKDLLVIPDLLNRIFFHTLPDR